jgi:hypothetical protein
LLPVTSHHDKTLQILSAGVQEICSRKADVWEKKSLRLFSERPP